MWEFVVKAIEWSLWTPNNPSGICEKEERTNYSTEKCNELKGNIVAGLNPKKQNLVTVRPFPKSHYQSNCPHLKNRIFTAERFSNKKLNSLHFYAPIKNEISWGDVHQRSKNKVEQEFDGVVKSGPEFVSAVFHAGKSQVFVTTIELKNIIICKLKNKYFCLFTNQTFHLKQSKPGRVPKDWEGIEESDKPHDVAFLQQPKGRPEGVLSTQQKLAFIAAYLELFAVRTAHL